MLSKSLLALVLIGFCWLTIVEAQDPAPTTSDNGPLSAARRVLELLYNNGLKLPASLLKMLNIPVKTTDAPLCARLVASPQSPSCRFINIKEMQTFNGKNNCQDYEVSPGETQCPDLCTCVTTANR